MNIIITMAGLGSRFYEQGYNKPKFMIEAFDKTLFEWSLTSLEQFNKPSNTYWFIVRKETESKGFIESQCHKMKISNIRVIEIDYLTSGQAETALLAIQQCNESDEVLVYNIDTYINPKFLNVHDIKGEGFLPCFNAPGNNWSFAKCDEFGNVIEVREKHKISDNASLGVYYFKSAKLYVDTYKEYYKNDSNLEKNERYIAPMYNYLIENGMHVFISTIPYNEVHVLGTPEELQYFINTFKIS